MTTASDFLALKARATRLLGPSPMWARAAPRVLRELGGSPDCIRNVSDAQLTFTLGKVTGRLEAARRAGQARSEAKAAAARRNGCTGGRPREHGRAS